MSQSEEFALFNYNESTKSHWCIVQIDDHGSGWSMIPEGQAAPAQYCRDAEAATPLQRCLHRAISLAPSSQIMVTAFEEYRHLWEPSLWFVRPERRFVCDNRAACLLSSAAAILSVAACSPSNVITILPARCAVVHEWILRRALKRAQAELANVAEGAITLGMIDREEGIDEDYLVVGRAPSGPGSCVEGFARRPVPWVARHLKHGGAVVSSGIMIGYAGVFAAHISKNWPGVSKKLAQVISAATIAGEECEIPSALNRGVPPAVLHSLRWHPPAFPQRVLNVCNSGWSGLKSARAIARVSHYRSNSTESKTFASAGATC
jgi:mannose-1-phosphate guanylyltransferase